MSLIRISRAESGDVDSVNSLTGALTIVGISGVSVTDDGSTTITISQADVFFTPVDARAVTGNILSDTSEAYDIGTSGTRFGNIFAASGEFATIRSRNNGEDMTIGPRAGGDLYIISDPYVGGPAGRGAVYFTDQSLTPYLDLALDTSQVSFATSDSKNLTFHSRKTDGIITFNGATRTRAQFNVPLTPNATNTVDIGTPALKFRDVHATSGIFDEAVINGIAHSTVPSILYAVQASGGPVDQRQALNHIIPDTDSSYDIGTSGTKVRTVYAASGYINSIRSVAGSDLYLGGDAVRFWTTPGLLATVPLDIDAYNTDMHTFRPLTNMSGVLGDETHYWNKIFCDKGYFNSIQTGEILQSVSGTYSALATDSIVLCDATEGAFSVTLPAVVSVPVGKKISVKKLDVSVNAVTVDGNASELIDGSETVDLTSQYEAIVVISDGTEWWII